MPQREMELIRQRLAAAERDHEKGTPDVKSTASDKNKTTLHITESSGNVFADLGLAHPEQELLKAHLTLQIYRSIKQRKLTQAQAGEILGIKQPHVSALMRGQSGTFSVERLMDFLTALGHDIEIAVTPSRKKHGTMSVSLGESVRLAI